mgnify:CR=1 FL=1
MEMVVVIQILLVFTHVFQFIMNGLNQFSTELQVHLFRWNFCSLFLSSISFHYIAILLYHFFSHSSVK